ncbi:MAG TPA: hypothetical protein VEC37_05215 [Bacillota bacterium]|nr:hypothetical protein [Bacillota bacterium]
MKKMMIGLMVGTLISTTSVGVLAAPGGHPKPGPGSRRPGYEQKHNVPRYEESQDRKERELREDAGYILRRTAEVMEEAQQTARRGHRYSGFARAAAHQQKARELYKSGSYREAISFSLRARELAFEIIQNNNRKVRQEHRRDAREERYYDRSKGAELDARLEREKLGRDRDVIRLKIEFNL